MPTRINKYVASSSGLSRRGADGAIQEGRVAINGRVATPGDAVGEDDVVTLDSRPITPAVKTVTIMLNKPAGYVCSRQGQGSRTVYELLPPEYQTLKTVGRLDKDSCGLILLTSDGELANQLTHPRYGKTKVYEIILFKPLEPLHQQMINNHGVQLEDGPSKLTLMKLSENGRQWQVTMAEGRNRQIRRTFDSLGYKVIELRRIQFGSYQLNDLAEGSLVAV